MVLFLSTYADVDVSLTPAVRRRGAPARTLIHDFIMGLMCLKGGEANGELADLQCLMFSRRVSAGVSGPAGVLWIAQGLFGRLEGDHLMDNWWVCPGEAPERWAGPPLASGSWN